MPRHWSLFYGITMLLTGRHAMPVVIQWSTASATDLRERFLLSGVFFYLTLLPASFKASLGAGSSTSRLAGLHIDLRNIAPARVFVWITTIHKRVILYRLYLWFTAGQLCEESAPHGISTLFTTSWACWKSHALSAWPQSYTVNEKLRMF